MNNDKGSNERLNIEEYQRSFHEKNLKNYQSARNLPHKKMNLLIPNKKLFPDDFFDERKERIGSGKSNKNENKNENKNDNKNENENGDNNKRNCKIITNYIPEKNNFEKRINKVKEDNFDIILKNQNMNHSNYVRNTIKTSDEVKKKPLSANLKTGIDLSSKAIPIKLTSNRDILPKVNNLPRTRSHKDNLDMIFDSIPEEDEEKNKTVFFSTTKSKFNPQETLKSQISNKEENFYKISSNKLKYSQNSSNSKLNENLNSQEIKIFNKFNIIDENYENNQIEENQIIPIKIDNFRAKSSESNYNNMNEISTSGSYKALIQYNTQNFNLNYNLNNYNKKIVIDSNINNKKSNDDDFMKTPYFSNLKDNTTINFDLNKTYKGETKFKLVKNEIKLGEEIGLKLSNTPSNRKIKLENAKSFFNNTKTPLLTEINNSENDKKSISNKFKEKLNLKLNDDLKENYFQVNNCENEVPVNVNINNTENNNNNNNKQKFLKKFNLSSLKTNSNNSGNNNIEIGNINNNFNNIIYNSVSPTLEKKDSLHNFTRKIKIEEAPIINNVNTPKNLNNQNNQPKNYFNQNNTNINLNKNTENSSQNLPLLLPPLTTRTQPQKIQLEINKIFNQAQNFKEDPEINNKINNLLQNISEIKDALKRKGSKRYKISSAPGNNSNKEKNEINNIINTHNIINTNLTMKTESNFNPTNTFTKIKKENSQNKRVLKIIDFSKKK